MSDSPNYKGSNPNSCGYTEAEIESRAESKGSKYWKVRCLNGDAHKHDDRHPSAFYYPKNGWYECSVCGVKGFAIDRTYTSKQKRVGERRHARGGDAAASFRPDRIPKHATATATHDYKRVDGSTVHRVIRYDWDAPDADGELQMQKAYLPFHMANDEWTMGAGPVKWEPYNAYRVVRAKMVLIVEGEKCADALQQIAPKDVAVITSAFGSSAAQRSDWSSVSELISEYGCDVAFIPDRDKPGTRYIHSVAQLLRLDQIQVIHVGDANRDDGYDVADWLSEGNSWGDLPGPVSVRVEAKGHSETRSRPGPKLVTGRSQHFQETAYDREIGRISVDERIDQNREVTPQRVRWLIHQYVAAGQTTLIYGDSGGGKTTIVRSLVKHIVEATDPFRPHDEENEDRGERGRALWWLGEEDLALTKPKFAAADVSTDDVDMLDKGHKWSCEDTIEVQLDGSRTFVDVSPHTQLLNRIDRATSDGRPYRVIVIDPLSKMIGDTNKSDLFERRWDETIVTLEARGLAVIGIVHPRKDNPVNSTLEASLKGTERLFSLPRIVAYARAATSKALLRQAKEGDDGVSHRNPIRDRFNATENGELSEDNGLIGVLCPLKNSHEQPESLLAWQYSITVKNDVGAAKFSKIPWRAADFDYVELDGRSFGAAVAGKYVLFRREKQTKQEQLAAVQLEDQIVEAASCAEFLNKLFDEQKDWPPANFKKAVEDQGYSYNSGSFLRSRQTIAVFDPARHVWTRKPKGGNQ